MQVTKEGSVRVDLLGGTLDLEPINLIIPNVVTMNVATSLKAKVNIIQDDSLDGIKINSLDYDKEYYFKEDDLTDTNVLYSQKFEEMTFVLQILSLFDIKKGLIINLSSGAPAGSGLGGSSAMGVTLFSALSELLHRNYTILDTVLKVKGVEGRILNQGVPGYQDYFPALTGGILSLYGEAGTIKYKQLYSKELKEYLEDHITLVYSGISRNSGINNWDVYKSFFDQNKAIRKSMYEIAKLSYEAFEAINAKRFDTLLELIGLEGEERKGLAPNIVPNEIEQFYSDQLKEYSLGMKMCGAGGGGCYILTHKKENREIIHRIINSSSQKVLHFEIEGPL